MLEVCSVINFRIFARLRIISAEIFFKFLQYPTELAGEGNKPKSAQLELRLVQSKQDIENPDCRFKASAI